jgi:hypothetical protein
LIAPLIREQVSFANQATDDELYLYFNNVKAEKNQYGTLSRIYVAERIKTVI